jgi:hypothetical protein
MVVVEQPTSADTASAPWSEVGRDVRTTVVEVAGDAVSVGELRSTWSLPMVLRLPLRLTPPPVYVRLLAPILVGFWYPSGDDAGDLGMSPRLVNAKLCGKVGYLFSLSIHRG